MIAIVAPLPEGTVGKAYDLSLSAESGVAPYSWSIQTAQGQTGLPPGVSFSSAGVFSGSPTSTSGTFTFTILVFDSNNQEGAQIAIIKIT
jgi:large repetitive protein